MNKEEAVEELKTHLVEYLREEKGINIQIGENGNSRNNFKCLNPAHNEKHGSMIVLGSRCYCLACGATYDTMDLIALDNNLDINKSFFKVLEIGCKKYGITLDKQRSERKAGQNRLAIGQARGYQNLKNKTEQKAEQLQDYTKEFKMWASNLGASDYLTSRGITEETAKRFMLGYDMNCRLFGGSIPALIIPTSKYSYVARNISLNAEKENRYRKVAASQLFNIKAFESDRPVFIVEGELDAITIEQAGFKAVALGSTGNVERLIKYFETARPKNFLLLALDNDERGQAAQTKLKAGLINLQVRSYDVAIYGACKDANEFYRADAEAFTEALRQAEATEQIAKAAELENYRSTFAGNKLAGFCEHIQQQGLYNPISTGFKSLDTVLGGGLYAGLYVIGAVSSLGKTSFCVQLADQIAQQSAKTFEEWQQKADNKELWDTAPLPAAPIPNDVLFFSLEMGEDELIAKSLSRCTMQESLRKHNNTRYAKTTQSILSGKRWENFSNIEYETLYNAMAIYEKYAQYIKIVEAMGDVGVNQVREIVQRHTTLTGRPPIVIIDYLQILAPTLDRGTDKQNTDRAVLELKKISRDFKTPVIAISSFNRENYTEPVRMNSFKESGAVEYSSDILLGLQLEGMDYIKGEKDKERQVRIGELIEYNLLEAKEGRAEHLELKVLKNRNGTRGTAALDFFPMFNAFTERTQQQGSRPVSNGINWDAVEPVNK